MMCRITSRTEATSLEERVTKKVESESPFSRGENGIIPRRNKIKPESRRAHPSDLGRFNPYTSRAIVQHRPTPLLSRPSPFLFLLSFARNGPRLDRCPVLSISIPLPSRENPSPGLRTGPETRIRFTEWRGEK